MTGLRSLIYATARALRSSWPALVVTAVTYKLIALIVLTPLVGLSFRMMLSASGSAVLADQEILLFFLGPLGWICFIVVGALWLAIVALEQSALIATLAAAPRRRLPLREALHFAGANAWPVIQVTARLVALTLLAVAPLLLVAGLVYLALLTEYDINYYLQVQPPAFRIAVGIGVLLAIALIALLLRLFTGWFFALPIVLFEHVRSSETLRLSCQRAKGHRRLVLVGIVGWWFGMFVLSAIATAPVFVFGRFLVMRSTSSLTLLAGSIGLVLLLWSGVGLVVNLLSTTTFAALLFELYQSVGGGRDTDLSWLRSAEVSRASTGFRLTTTRIILGGLLGVIVAVGVGAGTLGSVRSEDNVSVTAHRGASAAAPENTMAAVKRAIADGADWVEIDVQETADGEVVVFHDSDFMKLAGVNLKIWDATTADLHDIDVGSWFAPEFKDERVPTLAQVLQQCKGKAGVNIELKYYGHDKQLEQRVAEIVDSHDMAAEVVVMSLKLDKVRKMKSLRPNWKTGLLMSVTAGDLKSIDVEFLAVNAKFADRSFIQNAHELGQEVYAWTVNDAPTMSVLISRGIDCLITDQPDVARAVLQQRSQMSVPERLLVDLSGLLGVEPVVSSQ